ncbi:hypothetical protein BHE97_17745 [Aeromicrobium sp. PE09-221]|uniref:TRAP transporter small permease n=1 Tax=Aeromicrobium sp. PE09-221 TaxID=1898043 RepID=UPI000B3EC34A|nr:TRAP transporter small permease [Aeromicrobium sp. PE09-221]OUZ07342.1 hypothetical protein BHE97_17745 [Aeromicrobium sp. PE09-221]
MIDNLDRAVRTIERQAARVAAAALFVMMVLVLIDTGSRYFLSSSVPGAYQFAGEYLLIAVVYLSLAHTQRGGGHAQLDALASWLVGRRGLAARWLTHIPAAYMLSILMRANWDRALEAWASNATSSGQLRYPLAPGYMLVCVGTGLLILTLLLQLRPGPRAGLGVPASQLDPVKGA